ncbi:MAG: hypothetical protein VKL39_00405 [Leptolyngbyaceae bacterium]|nr:hypothetical protein [Leptolyngbyaceae bacterium]
MKNINPFQKLKYLGVAALGSLIAAACVAGTPSEAKAQAAYGSYVGVGASFGVTSGEGDFEEEDVSAVISGRYRFVKLPISLRGQALVFTDTNAFVPTVSYDFPINWQTDLYLGAGVAFQDADEGEDASPIGNQTAFVLQPGIDYALPNSRLIIFGNSIIAFDAYREGGGVAASLQGGVGVNLR